MKLISISAGSFHCDGGALFGVIPKVLWNKVYTADKNNFTPLALRCLLVDQGTRKILIETGIGNHFSEKHLKNNGVVPGDHLENSLRKNGYAPGDITDVVLTHLHWDHATGAVKNAGGKFEHAFPHATHWCSKKQWEHSQKSNPREQTAFHDKVLTFLRESGKMKLVEKEGSLFPGIGIRFFNGHTPGQIIPFIHTGGKTVIYTADLIPTTANIPLLWIASYDLDPVLVMEEKEKFLEEVVQKKYILFFEHDFFTERATVKKNEKGFQVQQRNPDIPGF